MNAKEHKKLLSEFVAKGGSERLSKSLQRFSLQNHAKLKYELSKLKTEDKPKIESPRTVETPKTRKVFDDLIADYPVQLHSTFRRRWEVWLEACSWKMQLNRVDAQDAETAFGIQIKIYNCFIEFDRCQKILKHYREHKRIMPTEVATDFSKLTELELFKCRNKLRASITRRRQTIEKQETNLPDKEDESYVLRLHSLNRKKEQLQDKLNELLACEKLLKNG